MRALSCSVLVTIAACTSSKIGAPVVDTGGDTASDTADSVESDTDTPCTPTTEIPYDGIDQDCDGADLADVDGDGADAVEAGGTDCDDANSLIHPGAPEVPYDGNDQDCDGADQTDVDSDGYDSTRVDGDDCDDLNPDIHPGVEDPPGDGIDQDCDGVDPIDPDHGYTPDIVVCADGSGDYTTIQAAVDAAPDGSALAICPGTYEEYVTIVDRELVLYGQTTDPGEVVINGQTTGSAGFSISGPDAQVTLTWMTVLGGVNLPAFDARDGATTTVDTVDFCGDGYLGGSYGMNSEDLNTETTILRSKVCSVTLVLTGGAEIGMSILENVATSISYIPDDKSSIASMHNNIVIGPDSSLNLGNNGDIYLFNNTIADAVGLVLRVYIRNDEEIMPNVYIQDNIFSGAGRADYALWYVYWIEYSGPGDGYPSYFSNNILWNIEGSLGQLVECEDGGGCVTDDSMSRWIAKGNIESDPMFEYTAEMGSYGLGAGSPAIDAGLGDSDANGTTNDIGAFGGPDGNWWQEVPWLQK